VLFAAVALTTASSARAKAYTAPKGKVLVGVTGGRTADGYADAVGRRPAVFQFFVAWGDRFHYAYRRARQARAGLMVHLSTYDGAGTRERITPRAIAIGRGDRYLVTLGRDLAARHQPIYLRLLGEMNNASNPYSAFHHNGKVRRESHSPRWFRQAWRRTALIVRGGGVGRIDARLRALGLPRLRSRARRLPRPRVALQWAPMTAGSPDLPGNAPQRYWPGAAYVDWVGTDFYSRYPNFRGLERFYDDPRWAGKPFVFGEWGMWGRDEPDFVRRFFAFVEAHRRVRMLSYNQGNRPTSTLRLYHYPKAARAIRDELRSGRYSGRPPGDAPEAGRMMERPVVIEVSRATAHAEPGRSEPVPAEDAAGRRSAKRRAALADGLPPTCRGARP
jgi:hypothetical protein